MNLRKEQVLLLATVAVGALVFKSMAGDDLPSKAFTFDKAKVEAAPLPELPLAAAIEPAAPARNWFLEPSETKPLPPRELPFPARPPLHVIGLPLAVGPDLAWGQLLAISGEVVDAGDAPATAGSAEPASPTSTNAAASPAAASPAAVQEPQAEDRLERLSRTYDRVWNTANQRTPLIGRVIYQGDRFALEEPGFDFSSADIWLQQLNSREELQPKFKLDRNVSRIRLAESLENEIQRKKRRVPATGGQEQRAELVRWLLERGRDNASVYDEALQQAKRCFEDSKNRAGLQLLATVLRARGELGKEFELYQTLPPELQGSWSQYLGLGRMKWQLGLDADAESDLHRAVAAAASDPSPLPRAMLADFLRTHGDPEQAALEMKQALKLASMLPAEERPAMATPAVACLLAVGEVAAARDALAQLGVASPYLQGAIAYAGGQPDAALAAFEQAAGTAEAMPALLGSAACQLQKGDFAAAQTALQTVVAQAPLLRHRALCGLALLYLKTGKREEALTSLDRAQEAAPGDLYALYLRARVLRDHGLLQPAQEALTELLRQRDDFVYAVAERACLHEQLAQVTTDLVQAEHFLAARRYADRAVALAPRPVLELIELQARLRFAAADLAAAAESFEQARQAATSDADKLYARAGQILIDYRRNHVDEAREQLEQMKNDLVKDQPMHAWAEARLHDIDVHSKKEQLDDRFDRSQLGSVWQQPEGTMAQIDAGKVRFAGELQRQEESLHRVGAVKKAGNFLAAEVVMTLGTGNPPSLRAGLRLEVPSAGQAGGNVFQAWLGVRDGKTLLRVEDGREDPQTFELPNLDVAAGKPQRLRFELLPRNEQQKQLSLLCYWNNVPVHEPIGLKSVNQGGGGELKTVLFVGGNRGSKVDVAFDDYHLERVKEN